MKRLFGLLACTVVLGLGALGAAGCGSGGTTDGDSEVVDATDSSATDSEGMEGTEGTDEEDAGEEEVAPPATEDCAVAGDEDADGATDCADADCAGDPACSPPLAVEGDCADGVDGDSDGDLDCADADCSGDAACPPPPATPEDCSAAGDEDGDGDSNCSDSDCAGDPACSGGGGGAWEIDPHWLDKYKAVDKNPLPGPGPVCLSCPYDFGTVQDEVTNPGVEKGLGQQQFESF